jgi:hypothetical protein
MGKAANRGFAQLRESPEIDFLAQGLIGLLDREQRRRLGANKPGPGGAQRERRGTHGIRQIQDRNYVFIA